MDPAILTKANIEVVWNGVSFIAGEIKYYLRRNQVSFLVYGQGS